MSHLHILGQVWPITALIPQLNQPRVCSPLVSGSLPSHMFLLLLQVPCTVPRVTGSTLGNPEVWQPHPSGTGNTFQFHSEHTACLAQPVPMAHIYWDLSHTLDMEGNTKQGSSSPEEC